MLPKVKQLRRANHLSLYQIGYYLENYYLYKYSKI